MKLFVRGGWSVTRESRSIVYVIGSLAVAGAESQLALLAEQMHLRGWSTAVFALDASGPLAERLHRSGVRVADGRYSDAGSKVGRYTSLSKAVLRLGFYLARNRPAVVHGFLPLTNFLAALLGRLTRAPVVITSKRGLGNHQARHPRLKWMYRVANALSDIVTANSRAVARDAELRDSCPASKLRIIPNGLDFSSVSDIVAERSTSRQAFGLAEEDVGIVSVANLIPYKGHFELVDAFAHVLGEFPNVKLFLVGEDRGIQSQLVELAAKKGVNDRVTFLGLRRDVPSILAAMDVGVLASHEEGFSNAVLEKLAVGLPVVATAVGGNAEALDDMPNCHLVKARDTVDLARGLCAAIGILPENDRDRGKRMKRIQSRYSISMMVDSYEGVYRSILKFRNSPRSDRHSA